MCCHFQRSHEGCAAEEDKMRPIPYRSRIFPHPVVIWSLYTPCPNIWLLCLVLSDVLPFPKIPRRMCGRGRQVCPIPCRPCICPFPVVNWLWFSPLPFPFDCCVLPHPMHCRAFSWLAGYPTDHPSIHKCPVMAPFKGCWYVKFIFFVLSQWPLMRFSDILQQYLICSVPTCHFCLFSYTTVLRDSHLPQRTCQLDIYWDISSHHF